MISFNIQNFPLVGVQFLSDFMSKKIEYLGGSVSTASPPANKWQSLVGTRVSDAKAQTPATMLACLPPNALFELEMPQKLSTPLPLL